MTFKKTAEDLLKSLKKIGYPRKRIEEVIKYKRGFFDQAVSREKKDPSSADAVIPILELLLQKAMLEQKLKTSSIDLQLFNSNLDSIKDAVKSIEDMLSSVAAKTLQSNIQEYQDAHTFQSGLDDDKSGVSGQVVKLDNSGRKGNGSKE